MRASETIALIALMGGIAACASYSGDGTFSDRGIGALYERYSLDLGPVQLGVPWRREYAMSNLPNGEFTVGLRLSPSDADKAVAQAVVRLLLTNEKGEVVFQVNRPLSNWVRGGSLSDGAPFLYIRGVNNEIPIAGGGVRLEPIAGPDGGWGTYFSPRPNGSYRLVYETIKPERSQSNITATLVAVGTNR
jgi:hypothetical protein